MIPIVNLIILKKIIYLVMDEIDFESEKERINNDSNSKNMCQT